MNLGPLLLRVVLIALIVTELVSRVATRSGTVQGFPLAPFDRAAAMRHAPGSSYLMFDRDCGWSIGASRRSTDGLWVSSASGLRATTGTTEAIGIVYGGSLVHGDAVATDATIPAILTKLAGKAVLNAGVPGYGVDQALMLYRTHRSTLGEGVVIVGYAVDDIARLLNRYPPHISPLESIGFSKPRFKLTSGALELVPSPFAKAEEYRRHDLTEKLDALALDDPWFRPGWYERRPLDTWRTARVYRTLVAREQTGPAAWRALYEKQEAVELTARLISAFSAEIITDGRRPLFVVLPDRTVIRDVVAGRGKIHDIVAVPLKRSGVPLLDLTDAIAGYVKAQPSDEKLFLPHYCRELNEVAAGEIAKVLSGGR